MRENETHQGTPAENLATPRTYGLPAADTTQPVPGPHFATHSPHVLARVPDLASAESETEQSPFSGKGGRMLSSGLSMKVLAGVGALLLLAALGLPFLFSASDISEPDENDTSSVWQPEQPAPSAPMAPAWGGTSHETANWEVPSGAQGFAHPDMSSTPAWNEDSQSADPNAYLQGQPLDAASQPQAWSEQPWADQSAPQAWNEQPPARARVPEQNSVPSGSQPYWELPTDQSRTPTWSGQVDVAAGPSPHGQTGWSPQPSSTPEASRRSTTSWNEKSRTPSWEVPPYRTSGQADAQRSATVDRYAPQGRSDYSSGDYASRYPATRGSRYPRQQQDAARNAPVEYRAADARGGLPTGNPAAYRSGAGYQSTVPAASYPPINSVPSRYPAYNHPPTSSPPSRYPAHSLGPINNAGRSAPAAGVPAADYKPTVYPTAGRSAGDPSSYNVSAMPPYGVAADTRLPDPGVARFQGGIEKPTGSNPYDSARPSTY